MDRRKAIAIAGTVGVTVAAASAAAFANVSLLSSAGATDGVGELDAENVAGLVEEVPTSTTLEDLLATSPDSTVVYVDEYVTAPGGGSAVPPAPGGATGGATVQADGGVLYVPPSAASTPAPAPGTPVGGYDDHDEDEDDEHEDEEHEEEDEEDEHEYEYEDDDD
jgi:hypothetical protein